MAVGADHGAVQTQVAGLESGDGLQLGGDKVLLHNAVFLVQQLHHRQLHPFAALVVLEGAAAHQKVEALGGDSLPQRLLRLILGQMGEQIVHGKHRVARAGADGHLNGLAVLQGHHAVEFQGDGHPLILADAAIVVGLEKGQLAVLIKGAGLQIQPGRVDVGGGDVGALAQGRGADDRQHDGLAPVDPVDLVSGLQGHSGGEGLEALGLGQRLGGGNALPLRLTQVQELFVVLAIAVHGDLILGTETVIAVLGVVEQRVPTLLTGGLFGFFHGIFLLQIS